MQEHMFILCLFTKVLSNDVTILICLNIWKANIDIRTQNSEIYLSNPELYN